MLERFGGKKLIPGGTKSFNVTQDDIDRSLRGYAQGCAITKAAQRHFEHVTSVGLSASGEPHLVFDDNSFLGMRGKEKDLGKWVKNYDNSEAVPPIAVELHAESMMLFGHAKRLMKERMHGQLQCDATGH